MQHTELISDTHAFAELERDARENLLKHAYVFESADFGSLSVLADMFVCLCEYGEVREDKLARIRDGGYTDIVRFPLPDKKGKIDVADASYITDTAYYTPTELSTKYYILAPSEPLAAAVQNKLLKTLEEPPESARFILFSRGSDLLPTVTSRSSVVRLEEFSVDTIERELIASGADEVTALMAAALGRGNLGFAKEAAANPATRKAYEAAMNFLLTVKRSPQILPSASELASLKDSLGTVIDCFELILRDVMAYEACGTDAVVLKPAMRDILTLSREFETTVCLGIMDKLALARRRIELYGNAQSVIDQLLFSVLEVKAKCRKS